MISKNKILLLLLLLLTINVSGQYSPPKTKELVDLSLAKLCPIDSTFICLLENALLQSDNINKRITITKNLNVFNITIIQKDSAYYKIYIELSINPSKKGMGYIVKGDFIYVFQGDLQPLFNETKTLRKFSYSQFSNTIDPPFWILCYNSKNNSMKIIEEKTHY
ncbi:MAG: hypothetical protein LUG18_01310 [Candidatus Azobacteroides sp.]|nr:hypothetical protein [Candidatus Azobacteroides sp.]